MSNDLRHYLTAEEAHFVGEPCYHVVEFYARLRDQRRRFSLRPLARRAFA